MNNWYVVYTQAGKELYSAKELKRQKYQVYFPQETKIVKHARKVKTILKPYFPRYIFVKININKESWNKINFTRGVVKLISSGGYPIPLPCHVIDELMRLEDKNGIIKNNNMKQGDNIEIIKGVFKGKNAIFESLSDNLRVNVLLDFLGKKLKTPINNDWIIKT